MEAASTRELVVEGETYWNLTLFLLPEDE